MVTKRAMIFLTILSLLASAPALAVKGGFYVGGSVGGATTEASEGDVKFDGSDPAWKLFAGYHFLQFFAVEASYRDLGAPTDNIQGTEVEVDTTAFDVAGLVGVPLGPIFLFGKLGIVQWDSDISADGSKISDDGTDYEAGIGLSLDIAKVQLRGELEYLDVDDGALMYTVGAAWRF